MNTLAILQQLQTLIRALTEFVDADVEIQDMRVLSRGAGPFCVLWPQTFEIESRSDDGARLIVRYLSSVDIFVHAAYPDAGGRLAAARDAVGSQLMIYPGLNGLNACLNAWIDGGSEPQPIYDNDEANFPAYWLVSFTHYARMEEHYAGQGEY